MSSGADDKQTWMALRAADRPALAEIRARRVNEAIERGARGQSGAVFLCECGFLGCSRTIELPLTGYAAARRGFDRFLLAPGHEQPALDRVVERHDDHVVVVKRDGRSAERAKLADPRGGDDG